MEFDLAGRGYLTSPRYVGLQNTDSPLCEMVNVVSFATTWHRGALVGSQCAKPRGPSNCTQAACAFAYVKMHGPKKAATLQREAAPYVRWAEVSASVDRLGEDAPMTDVLDGCNTAATMRSRASSGAYKGPARAMMADLSNLNFNWVVGFKEFANTATETFSIVGQAGPTFFLAISMLGFVIQISALVTEKKLKLCQAMSIMGLYESAYQ